MRIERKPNRIAIYFFYDKDGVADQYVFCFLGDLKKNVSKLLIVSNGSLTEDSEKELKKYGEVLVRENTGFDVWAYKEALAYVGWKTLEQYDEVIMLNSTIMGPVYPLKETFEKMDRQDLDFWGITLFFGMDSDPSGCCRYGYVPDHIQSHFIACRRSLVQSAKFREYWETMPMIHTYWEAVGKHEMVFTKYFEELGYRRGISVDMEDLRSYSGYPLMICPSKLIKERRCPIFKKKIFFDEPQGMMSQSAGEEVDELLRVLKAETNYNVEYIWETILRNHQQANFVKNMKLIHILSERGAEEFSVEEEYDCKAAVFLYLKNKYATKELLEYVLCVPEEVDLYFIVQTGMDRTEIDGFCKNCKSKKKENTITILETNARNETEVFLRDIKSVAKKYDLLCYVHDTEFYGGTVAESYRRRMLRSLLASESFVKNVMHCFASDLRLGMLTPPVANHGPFFTNVGKEWREFYDDTAAFLKDLNISVPITESFPPITSLDSTFWIRTSAISQLWENEGVIEAGMKKDEHRFKNIINRAFPYVVQQNGFYPGIVLSEQTAEIELGNLSYYLREYNKTMMKHGIESYHQYMNENLEARLLSEEKLCQRERELEQEVYALKEALYQAEHMSLKTWMKYQIKHRVKGKKLS